MLLGISILFAGVLSFFSPCVFPLLPVYLGVLLDESQEKTIQFFKWKVNWMTLLKTLVFIFGISFIFVALGFGAGWIGSLFFNKTIRNILGIVVVILGLHQLELIHIQSLYKQKQIQFSNLNQKGQVLKALFLGVSLSLGWSPCIGPILSSILVLAATGGNSAILGGIYMLVYSIGFSLPFLVIALFSSVLLKKIKTLQKHLLLFKRIGGVLIIIMGLLLIFGNINILSGI